ncbi:ATP-dependent Lhr-like helicase [Saccharothrix coeruleofusca]|uniref:DEAD/DEAH box helicase n=1 Tax=Saccharothrix coeruleofusca TaxID=33919 RepID=UPI001AE85133|nr:DEAD/DEAH box helicase [Saccharothrix coeruleofusca]MBP2334561.1 ATP-dependent Lhr-like helicase [Saccharothrix coeruleofusca]
MSDAGLRALTSLHPVIQHHVVNTLGWPGLRPLQAQAVEPVLSGADCLLLAPTAGGKTEAASFPVLSRMASEGWTGTSVLYVCPLRALLNNLAPRLASYAEWLGRRAEVWHGDTGQAQRKRILRERPDVLLTTPESLEAMLVSVNVDTQRAFGELRAVIVDEVHAFAGDDRGWHLLAVLERLSRVAGRQLQRIGLSATVGNPAELLTWLQGGHHDRPRQVVAPAVAAAATAEVTLDHVGTIDNAATVIATLHRGEKRLVFVDSRRRAEELGAALRARDVTTFLSHSSLSAAERRRSEEAFSEARDCVIVATSTLELGIDVGDLDRVIQIDAPRTVASFLQRLGRTGRRAGSSRNCLFLCLERDSLLHAAGLLQRWSQGWVEPISAPPSPRHIIAQQLLASALQEKTIGVRTWRQRWGGLPLFGPDAPRIMTHLLAEGFLDRDGDLAFIGPQAERKFGRRHFSDLTAVFTAAPEFLVLFGREEIGQVGDEALLVEVEGPRVLLLGGRTWQVTHVDWPRRRCYVEPSDLPGRARWGGGSGGLSFAITRGMREVLLGADPPGVVLTRRARTALADLREHHSGHVAADGTLVVRSPNGDLHWWTWAGAATNRTLHASLPGVVDRRQRIDDRAVRLFPDLKHKEITSALAGPVEIRLPEVNDSAVAGLKFAAALPEPLARATVAERLVDHDGVRHVLTEQRRHVRESAERP